jgi:hypothetical protein
MSRPHPQAEATYRVIRLEDGAFGVEVITPEAEPATVKSFATEADAEAWIDRQKSRIASKHHGGDGRFGTADKSSLELSIRLARWA